MSNQKNNSTDKIDVNNYCNLTPDEFNAKIQKIEDSEVLKKLFEGISLKKNHLCTLTDILFLFFIFFIKFIFYQFFFLVFSLEQPFLHSQNHYLHLHLH